MTTFATRNEGLCQGSGVRIEGLFLTPGAGSTREHSSLRAIEAAVAPLPVIRHDFPYRREGRKAPDRAPKAIADVVAHVPGPRWVLGGRSFGGRMCSMAVADGLPAAGLVLISYPLHPPGRPEKLRVEHFGQITVPTLFVSGDKDPFGTPDELAEHVAAIPGPVTTVTLSGAHDMRGAARQEAVAAAVAAWVASL